MPMVEGELRRIARRCMAGEKAGHSLQATALVNEAYLRPVDAQRVRWQDRSHFLAMSARLMRRVLVDYARGRLYQKRGGGAQRVTLVDELGGTDERPHDLVALDDALEALARATNGRLRSSSCGSSGVSRSRRRRTSLPCRRTQCTGLEAGQGLAVA